MADSPDVIDARRLICGFGFALAVLPVGGCVRGGRAERPEAVLSAYGAALARGDAEGAYALLSAADRDAITLADYRRALAENAAEARELGARLARVPRPSVWAETQLDDGSPLRLQRDTDGFGVEDPLGRFYDQSTPRGAIWAFVRAVERERWDVVYRLLPSADREGLDVASLGTRLSARREALTRSAARLWTARAEPIEEVGDRATMPYGESFSARLVREDGLWRLESAE